MRKEKKQGVGHRSHTTILKMLEDDGVRWDGDATLLSGDWDLVYNVSSGMDVHATPNSQTWNPFNGNATAPKSWFSFGTTDEMYCAYNSRTNQQCVFTFEYEVEYGLMLQKMASEMNIQCLCLQSIPAQSASIAGIPNGSRPCLTAITFSRPKPVIAAGTPGCCEMHGLLHCARETQDTYLQPILYSRVCTSGHMAIRSLLDKDPYGEWEPLVQKWLAGDFVDKIFCRFKTKSSSGRRLPCGRDEDARGGRSTLV